MTQEEIEHMWKVASNNPNHDTNWHDPVVIAFAKLVEEKATEKANARANASWTLMCKKMVAIEREACARVADEYMRDCEGRSFGVGTAIRARGEQA